MHLTSFTPTADDFEEFFRHCFHRDRFDAGLRAAVGHEWRVFLKNPAALTLAVADQDREPGSRLVGCAQDVFVSEAFLQRAVEEEAPRVIHMASHRLPDGSQPLLSPEDVRKANAQEGLNVLITRWQRADVLLSADEQRRVYEFMNRVFLTALRGYHLKEVLLPTIGEFALCQGLAAGFRLRRDYAGHFQRHPPLPAPERRPYLLSVTREESFAGEGSLMSHFFVYTPPRLALLPRHKEFLRLALDGLTDEEIADALCVSVSGVKNWWRDAYRHVATVDPERFASFGEPDATGPGQPTREVRGKEKRRLLLQHLREHPEELGPG